MSRAKATFAAVSTVAAAAVAAVAATAVAATAVATCSVSRLGGVVGIVVFGSLRTKTLAGDALLARRTAYVFAFVGNACTALTNVAVGTRRTRTSFGVAASLYTDLTAWALRRSARIWNALPVLAVLASGARHLFTGDTTLTVFAVKPFPAGNSSAGIFHALPIRATDLTGCALSALLSAVFGNAISVQAGLIGFASGLTCLFDADAVGANKSLRTLLRTLAITNSPHTLTGARSAVIDLAIAVVVAAIADLVTRLRRGAGRPIPLDTVLCSFPALCGTRSR